MKQLLTALPLLLLQFSLSAQQQTSITIIDISGHAVPNASITLEKTGTFIANEKGTLLFSTRQTGVVHCEVSSVGFQKLDTTILLPARNVQIVLRRAGLLLDPIEIRALRANDRAPFAKTNLSKAEIEKLNLGQDLPFLLNQTPSVTITSDAGNGIGYTSMRIRGTDATRINVTINGIPYNDAESQGTYFVDLPDLSSSLSSIQVQRGAGTSSNGAGAFGASINLSTNEVNEKAYAEINNSFGSFNSWKNTVKFGTGLIDGHFTFDGRLSRISSDGFIDRAATNLKSLYASGAYLSKKSSLRVNIISGTEITYQAWNGIPQYKLFYNKDSLLQHYYNNIGSLYFTPADSVNLFSSSPRKYNVFTYPNQTDNYQQDHYQLFYNQSLQNNWSLNTAVYLSKGKGYYEEYKYNAAYSNYGLPDQQFGNVTVSNTDLVRQLWLKNNLYGTIFSLLHKTDKTEASLGGGWNEYDGDHYGNIIWAANGAPKDYQWYFNKAVKKDFNLYGKYQFLLLQNLHALLDLQYRRVDYNMHGTVDQPTLELQNSYKFFNPKFGLTYTLHGFTGYASYAFANKEPNRDDYENATANVAPKPEHLQDLEIGVEENHFNYAWGLNFYYMNYRDQLILTGKINDVGNAIRINTPHSYRAGLELQGRYKLNNSLQISGNLTVSDNKIKDFHDYVPRYDASFNLLQQDTLYFHSTKLAFSPSVIASGLLQWFPFKNAEINSNVKYTGRQYLDNTSSLSKSIDGYFVQDLTVEYTLHAAFVKDVTLIARLSNVWNKMYSSNGYTYSYIYDKSLVQENFFFPMAGRNFMLALNFRF